METMEISPDTKVKDLVREYPYLEREILKVFPKLRPYVMNPFTRSYVMTMTLGAIANRAMVSFEEIKPKIEPLLVRCE